MVVPIPTQLPWTAATIGVSHRPRAQQPPDGNLLEIARRRVEEIGEVIARSEILAFAAQRDQADRNDRRGAFDRVREGGIHGDCDRIAALGPGKRDRQHRRRSDPREHARSLLASRIG